MGRIKPKELSELGYTDDVARSIATEIISKSYKHETREEIVRILREIHSNPDIFKGNLVWGKLAEVLSPSKVLSNSYELHDSSLPYTIFGADNIDSLAISQMEMAMRLPITVAGALLPDGCSDNGLPIGGVLATTDDVIIPYAIGKDIGCRMSLTILDAAADYLDKYHDRAVDALDANTAFGLDGVPYKQHNPLFGKSEFREISILKELRENAMRQLGSCGKGSHFVDICEVELTSNNALGLAEGNYLAILSHSGSRSLGASIADYYTVIAKETCRLPRQAEPFAWLDINSEAGQDYWRCMHIAGEYSALNHEIIHLRVAEALQLQQLKNISNHHNFAWREKLPDGRTVIIHRKGSIPAHQCELGIIPGSMTTPGYIVTGKGNYESLFSASHGAGRTISRQEARNNISRYGMKQYLAEKDITLLGGTTEEAPQAYKDIELVMQSQRELINIEGKIIPRIIKMSDE